MSGIVGGINLRSSGLVNNSSAADGQVFTGTGAGLPAGFEAASAAGFTYVDEEDVTAGSANDVRVETFAAGTKLIHLIFEGVSLSGTASMNVQLGDADGIETSGYLSTCHRSGTNMTASTASFLFEMAYADTALDGIMTLARVNDSHVWIASFTGRARDAHLLDLGGSKTLSAELTRIALTPVSGTFDAGAVRALYI